MIKDILRGKKNKKLQRQPDPAVIAEARMLSEQLLSVDVSHIDVNEAKKKIRARVLATQALKFN